MTDYVLHYTLFIHPSFLQNDSELFGRTIRVNIAAPQRIKEGSTRPVWSEDTWLQKHAGETLKIAKEGEENEPAEKTDNAAVSCFCSV